MPNLIPKIIHQIWIGEDIPALQALYMAKFKTMKHWKYILWTNDMVTPQTFPMTWKFIQKSVKAGKKMQKSKFAQIADMMRLEILYHYGGVYVDTTLEPLKNFTPLFASGHTFYICNEDPCGFECVGKQNKRYISNSFIASIPKHPVLKRLLTQLKSVNFHSPLVNMETGPYYLGKHIKSTDDVFMLDTDIMYPHGYENKYKTEKPDKCFSYETTPDKNITFTKKNGEKVYLEYPCHKYPDSFGIKHWEVGGTWH